MKEMALKGVTKKKKNKTVNRDNFGGFLLGFVVVVVLFFNNTFIELC